jgi:exodeoxyribonuclease V alpha subunit
VLELQGYQVVQSALTGKAAKRMIEATEMPAITIASFICQKRKAESRGEAVLDKKIALIIDEASMVDLISFSGVIRVIDEDTKIILIGDPNQLPPVGPGLILHCLVEVPSIPHVELKVAKRFGNQIAGVANSVKDGVLPDPEQFKGDLHFIKAGEAEMPGLAAQLYLDQPEDTVVLCATRKVAKDINELVHSSLRQGRKPIRKVDLEYDMWVYAGFYEGDLLICTQNHWDLGIQHGSIGRLVEVIDNPLEETGDIDAGSPVIGWILWDDGERRPLHEGLLDSLELGYVLTCHKSQGAAWRRVIICLPASNKSTLIERSLVYTAITRSRSEIVVLGNHTHLAEAIAREKATDRRNVGLTKRLLHALA